MKSLLFIVIMVLGASPAGAKLLEEPWPAPEFSMMDQNADTISSTGLRGRVYIADFFFTTCNGPCPLMTAKLVELASKVKDPEIRFIGFTVDPKHDKPPILRAYAKERGATDSRIHFLVGGEEDLRRIAAGMKLGIQPGDASHRIIHSDRFMLIDKTGQIRQTYRPLDPESFEALIKDIPIVAAPEPTPMMKRFPAINASLNAMSGILILIGLFMIKTGRWRAHAACMISAVICSAAFLACYITFHYLKTKQGALLTRFPEHWLRPVYLTILISHTILAAAVLPLIIMTVTRAAKRQWDRHVKIAPITFGIWIYVSVTGVAVYFMLYHIAPGL